MRGARPAEALLLSLLLLAGVGAAAPGAGQAPTVQLPDVILAGVQEGLELGRRVAYHGDVLISVSSIVDGDLLTFFAYQSGVGWQELFQTPTLKSGVVAIAMNEDWVLRSFGGKVVISGYDAGGLTTSQTLLQASSPALALDGSRAALGRPGSPRGEILIFETHGGSWQFASAALGPDASSGFGASGLALQGDFLFVGMPFPGGGSPGEVQILRRDPSDLLCPADWCKVGQSLFALDGELDDGFGTTVEVFGDWLAVGAPLDDRSGPQPSPTAADSGVIHLYQRQGDSWTLAQSLRRLQFSPGDRLGESLALWNGTLVAGAPGVDVFDGTLRTDMGTAHLFLLSNGLWSERKVLRGTAFGGFDAVGTAVAVGRRGTAVGAPLADELELDGGAVYVFPDIEIFADGFESGNLSKWALTEP